MEMASKRVLINVKELMKFMKTRKSGKNVMEFRKKRNARRRNCARGRKKVVKKWN